MGVKAGLQAFSGLTIQLLGLGPFRFLRIGVCPGKARQDRGPFQGPEAAASCNLHR